MAMADKSAIGCSWRITAGPFAVCWPGARWVRSTTSAGSARWRTSTSSTRSAIASTGSGRGSRTGRAETLISFVADRPGHDRRYAIDFTKIRRDLGWTPRETFATGIERTVRWYLDNTAWIEGVTSGGYRQERLGLHAAVAAQ